MSEADNAPGSDIPLYDVVVTVPPGRKLEEVDRLGREAGIQPERVAALVNALRSVPQAKIGAGVTRERADKAQLQFTAAGLIVEITPVLALGALVTGSFDGLHHCPACNTRVALPENRQCPSCGVYVDKVTDEALLRRKIMEQEKSKLDFQASRDAQESEKKIRESLEASLRAQVRAELEAQYGLNRKRGFFGGTAGVMRLAGLVGLLAAAFVGGKAASMPQGSRDWKTLISFGSDKTAAKASSPTDVDKLLDSVGPKTAGDTGTAGMTGDPDIDDPLIQAATKGKKMGGGGITLEQAVAASSKLAASVGNTTAQRAMNGGGGGAPASAGTAAGAGPGGSAAGAQGAGGTAAADGVPTATVPPGTKLLLLADFAKQLSEMGQVPRANGVIASVKASPTLQGEPAAASAVRVADIEVQAWAMHALGEGRARQAADALMKQARALPDDGERAHALARASAILSRHAQLPTEAARAFLTEAAESLKTVADVRQRTLAASAWAVALGQVLMAQTARHAKAGAWAKAKAVGEQLDELTKRAPDESALIRLHAIGYQVRQQLGLPDKAAQSLDAALALAGKTTSMSERAAQLRVIAQLSEAAAGERMQAILAALQAQAAATAGMERAQTLASLSLLAAESGMRGKAIELAELSRATTGLSPAEAVMVNTDLIVRGDLAAAKLLHAVGLYSESEAVLQRVGGYLL